MIKKIVLIGVSGLRSKSIFHWFYKMKNIFLLLRYWNLRNRKKIIYVLTPPPQLSNIGDHAQAIAIKKWIADNYIGMPVIEFNKDETIYLQWSIKKITNNSDIIFIHSGGNLGDSGLWSEKGRRLTIMNFPKNKIVSLPQTIFFSDTGKGKKELLKSEKIYNGHKNLTVIARDYESEKLAKLYFPKTNVFSCPDFVLYLKSPSEKRCGKNNHKYGVLCLRNDIESALDNKQTEIIKEMGKQHFITVDTTVPRLITRRNRMKEFRNIVRLISNSSIMITDRFHGLIFSVLAKTPCIVLSTTNHKLVSAFKWFEGINFVSFANNVHEIPELIDKLMKMEEKTTKNFNQIYFNKIKDQL